MVLHIRPSPDFNPERLQLFVQQHIANIVNCLARTEDLDDATAWEIAGTGLVEAFAQRLARDPGGEALAIEIGFEMANRIKQLQAAQAGAK